MHAPTKTSILYAAPQDPSNRLFPLGQRLHTIFEEKEYMAKDTRPLKLHATIVNTIYAKAGGRYGRAKPTQAQPLPSQPEVSSQPEPPPDPADDVGEPNDDPDRVEEELKPEDRSSDHGPNARAPLRFDATALMEQFKEFVWARDFRVEKIAICKMGAKKILDENGDVVGEEYEEVASIGLP
jgi:activating signal cointegrator complex subunit 1